MKKFSILVAAMCMAVGFGSMPVRAEGNGSGSSGTCACSGGTYPTKRPSVVVSSPVIGPDDGFTITATGFCPGDAVSFEIITGDNDVWGPVTADSTGTAVFVVKASDIPDEGVYQVFAKVLTGPCQGQFASTTIKVLDDAPPDECDIDDNDNDNDDNDDNGNNNNSENVAAQVQPSDSPKCDNGACVPANSNKAEKNGNNGNNGNNGKPCPVEPKPADTVKPTPTANAGVTPGPAAVTPTPPANQSLVPVVTPAAVLPAAAVVPAAVLTAGVTAGAAASPAVRPVVASAQAPRDALPVTGSESSTTMQIALALLLGGVGLVAVTGIRRRQRANAGIIV